MVNVKFINDERLGRWKNQLNRKNATPVLLIGIGHDHNAGDVTVLVTEERSDEDIKLLLVEALRQLSSD